MVECTYHRIIVDLQIFCPVGVSCVPPFLDRTFLLAIQTVVAKVRMWCVPRSFLPTLVRLGSCPGDIIGLMNKAGIYRSIYLDAPECVKNKSQ